MKRLAASVLLLAVVFAVLDPTLILERLGGLRPWWVVGALAVSVAQVAASAWRWRFTAMRLGVDIPFRAALAEYYLATFLNQVLPGGVLGDVTRAWRHARAAAERAGPAAPVHAVILERVSGQVVMISVALGCVCWLVVESFVAARGAAASAQSAAASGGLWLVPLVALGAVSALAGLVLLPLLALLVRGRLTEWVRRRLGGRSAVAAFAADARRSLLDPGALPRQLASSLFVVASYLVVFWMAARAVSVTTPATTLLPHLAPVLVTMVLPVTVAGWGLREAAAGALWAAVGLTAVDGVTISIAYGILVLVSSLPGAAVLLVSPAPPTRDRRGHPDPAGSDEPRDEELPPAIESEPG